MGSSWFFLPFVIKIKNKKNFKKTINIRSRNLKIVREFSSDKSGGQLAFSCFNANAYALFEVAEGTMGLS